MTSEQEEARWAIIAQARKLLGAPIGLLTGPGAFERVQDKLLAQAIEVIDGHGFADEFVSEEGVFYAARCAMFVLTTNDQGFRFLDVYDSDERASEAMR